MLTLEQLGKLFRKVALSVLRLPESDRSTVRFTYKSAPFPKRTESVCFITIMADEDGYGIQQHETYRDDGVENKLTSIVQYTEVHRILFICYGPESYDWAKRIKRGIGRPKVTQLLTVQGIFLVSGTPRVVRVPEMINGEWWERADVSMRFYEAVREEYPDSVDTIEDVEIYTERSI